MKMENHIFFESSDHKMIYGVEYLTSSISMKRGIILCQPIAEEKIRIKRILVNFARFLADRQYNVFLFDYFGEGESEGNFEEATLESRVEDTVRATHFFRKKNSLDSLGILGFRLGANVAQLAMERIDHLNHLILVNPVVNGYEYLQEWFKSNLASQLAMYKQVKFNRKQLEEQILRGEILEVEGYPITKKLFEELKSLDLLGKGCPKSLQELIIEIASPDKKTIYESYLNFRKTDKRSIQYARIGKAFDWNNMKFYEPKPQELFNIILSWLERIENGRNY